MTMKKIILSLLVLTTLGTIGCKKHETVPAPVPTTNLDSYFENKETNAKQYFTVNSTASNSFTGNNGVVVGVPAHSFVYSNGDSVIGSVDFELMEILDVSDMVSLKKTTRSDNEILVSGGQIKLLASQNSSQVFLAPGKALQISIPTTNPDPQMELFVGNENASGDVNWLPSVVDTAQQDTLVIVTDTSSIGYYNFDFNTDSLGWINCDYFWNVSAPETTVAAHLPAEHDHTNTSCFLVFPNINSVISLYHNTGSSDGIFSTSYIPTGQTVIFVCISEIDGQFYSAFVNSTIGVDHVENINMTTTTEADLQAAIDNL